MAFLSILPIMFLVFLGFNFVRRNSLQTFILRTPFSCKMVSGFRAHGLWAVRFLVGLFMFSPLLLSGQTLTISNTGEIGTSGTNWSISGTTLTVTGTANIRASVIATHLASNDLSIVGNSTVFAVTVNEAVTVSTGLKNLTLGDGTNTGSISLAAAMTLNGGLTVFGGAISINQDVNTTSAGANGDILFKGSADINLADSRSITTDGGDVILWANSDGQTANGMVHIFDNSAISTNGGHIWMGGGSGTTTWNGLTVGDGWAYSGTTVTPASGTTFKSGIVFRRNVSINTNGGDFSAYGASAEGSSVGIGICTYGTVGIDVGSGRLVMDGRNTSSTARNGFLWGIHSSIIGASNSTVTISSSRDVPGENAIYLNALHGNSSRQAAYFEGPLNLESTGSSGIYLKGENTAGGGSIFFENATNILSASGEITLEAIGSGLTSSGASTVGFKASTAVFASSANITVISNGTGGFSNITYNTTGAVTIRPAAAATFSSAVTVSTNNYNSSISSLTFGSTSNTANITLSTALSIAGSLSIYGGTVAINQNLTSTLSGAPILLQATGGISLASSRIIQSNDGDIIFRSNSSGTAASTVAITLNSGSSVLSQGGDITLGGNFSGAEGSGLYATGSTSVGIFINDATISAAGGNIRLYGKCNASYNDGIRLQANITTTGTGTIGVYGEAHGGNNSTYFYGGISFIEAASTIETEDGDLTISGLLTNTQSNSTGAINFYRSTGSAGQTRHINLLSQTGTITVLGDRGTTGAYGIGHSSWGNVYVGSPSSGSWTATGNVVFTYSSLVPAGSNGIRVKTTGAVTYQPVSTSFAAAQTFPANANYILAENASGLTIGNVGNTANVTIGSAQTVAGPMAIYGGTVALNGAITATNSTLLLGATTALTQSAAITASALELAGAGTFTLSNTSNNVATIAGGTSGSRLGSLSYTDASGGLTIGTAGSTTGIYTTGTLLVETLSGNIHLNESVSSSNTGTNALIINSGKSSAIGVSAGGDILVSGTPTVTVGSGGIAKLFSGLETNSTGLTTLVGGSGNVRYIFDETTTTFTPALSSNNAYAIYRTNKGVGDLTIVASGGDALNSTWEYVDGVISTIASPVSIDAAELVNYLSTGALTIEAGNVTISSAITSGTGNAFVINSNGLNTIAVNAALSFGGDATFNTNDFTLGNGINISTSGISNITINANGNFSTTSTTRRTISTGGGDIVIHADKDANGAGALDLDYLTLNPGAGNIIIRGETASFSVGSTAGPYINGTGSFTFEPSDDAFGQLIYTSLFQIDQDANGISGLTIGKAGNTANIEQNTNITIGGPVNYYGGYVNINGNLTSSAIGDIFIKGVAGTSPSIGIQSGKTITKSGGTGTLTLQGHGRVTNSGGIATSGTGVLNVVMWSDFDNDDDDGGVSQFGTISTNGGHVWLGGSNSNGGSYNWNGLAVGDGPSIGASGFNANALDLYGNVTTNGGDFLAWAGSVVGSGGIAGIANDGGGDVVSVGSGNIVLITDMVSGSAGAAMYFTQTGGTFTLVPHDGSFRSAFNWNPAVQTMIGGTADDYNLQTGDFDWLGIGELNSINRVTIGYYNGMLNGTTPVEFTNNSNITFSTATSLSGAFQLYGGALALNTSITTTNTSTGDITLSGTSLSGTGNLLLAAGRTATLSVSSASTYDGIISGTGSGLTKAGAGLLTLTKDHTYTGATTISGGDLQVGSGGSVSQSSSGTISRMNGATQEGTSGVAVASGANLILAPNENIVFPAPVSGDGGVEIKGMSGTYRNTFLTTSATLLASNVTVLEVLTRITGGTMSGSAASGICAAYQKSYNAAANTATIQLQQLTTSTVTKVVYVMLEKINTSDVAIKITGAAYKSANVLGQDMTTVSPISMSVATTAGGTGYAISQLFMSGKVNFTGSLTYTGTTTLSNTVSSGTLPTYSYTSKGTQEITDASASFPGPIVNNGLVILNRTTPLTIAGDMSGTEDVLQVGAAVTFTGNNTHSGTTTVDLNKTLNIGSGGTSGSMTGNIVNYGSVTFHRSDASNYPGVLSGTGTLTKSASGDLTMTGLNTYTGATTVNAGRLILERDVPTTSSSGFSGAGTLVIQPSSASFTNAVSYPIPGFNVSSTIGGLTVGKLGNTADLTVTAATTVAGPITFYGGTMEVNENIAPTNSGNISLYANTLNFGSGKTVASSGELLVAPSTVGNSIGVAGSTGSLLIPDGYFTTNFADGFSSITIGSPEQSGNIVTRQVTIRDNMGFRTSGILTIESTPFDISTFDLTLGSSMTVLGMPTNYIKTSSTGVVKRGIDEAASGLFPIGNVTYNPVTIANRTGANDEFSARVADGVFQDGYSVTAITDKVVNRTWHIDKSTANAGSGVDMTFTWDAGQELGTMADYKLSHYGTGWSFATGTSGTVSVNGTTKTMTHTGYTGTFSPFAIGSSTGTLPVSWIDFTATRQGQVVELNWRTASEQNTKDFVVQHSNGNGSWKGIGNLAAAGNSNSERAYRFTHSQPVEGRNLYRLVQRDLDGKESISKVVSISMPSATTVQVYPVPSADGKVYVKLPSDQVLKLYSSSGVLMLEMQGKAGVQMLALQHLQKGLYYLQAGKETVRVLLQ